jgi:predicted ester cyclase
MLTRRGMLYGAAGAGLVLAAGDQRKAAAQAAQLERNKAVVRGFKEAQKTGKSVKDVEAEFMTPNYKRHRGGMFHLAANAAGQGFPGAGDYLRTAFPDRVDTGVEIIAEGDVVGYLFKLRGSHKGNFFGIPPTGKTVDVYEIGIFKLIDGRIAEAWFMADEVALLRQIGATLPPRKDGRRITPPLTGEGEDPDAVIKRLEAGSPATVEDRNRLQVARSKGSSPPQNLRAPDFRQRRAGFQNLREHGERGGVPKETVTAAMPERRDRIDGFIAEGDKVWMRFKLSAVHSQRLYGLPATGKRVEAAEIGILRVVDGQLKEGFYFGDEMGLLLQLGYVDAVLG